VLGKYSATVRGSRKVTVRFGEPIAVEASKNRRAAAADLTHQLEVSVQGLLDGLNAEKAG
jgi:hypothetical protein